MVPYAPSHSPPFLVYGARATFQPLLFLGCKSGEVTGRRQIIDAGDQIRYGGRHKGNGMPRDVDRLLGGYSVSVVCGFLSLQAAEMDQAKVPLIDRGGGG